MSPLPIDVGLCIRKLRKEKPDMKPDQRLAICLDVARRGGNKEVKPWKKE